MEIETLLDKLGLRNTNENYEIRHIIKQLHHYGGEDPQIGISTKTSKGCDDIQRIVVPEDFNKYPDIYLWENVLGFLNYYMGLSKYKLILTSVTGFEEYQEGFTAYLLNPTYEYAFNGYLTEPAKFNTYDMNVMYYITQYPEQFVLITNIIE